MERRTKLALFIVLSIFLIMAGTTWWLFWAGRQPLSGPIEPPDLVLTRTWDGAVVHVPGPLTVPDWMKGTRDYRRILKTGAVSALAASDPNGNTYVAHALCRMKDATGRPFVCFSRMEKRRPDGSMENVTHLAGDSEPFEWEVLDKDGNRTMRVSRGSAANYTITFLDNKGGQFAKEWQADSTLSIHSEQVRGEDGSYSFTHGSL